MLPSDGGMPTAHSMPNEVKIVEVMKTDVSEIDNGQLWIPIEKMREMTGHGRMKQRSLSWKKAHSSMQS